MRLLGDAVLRRNAREVATRPGWDSTFQAEYIALTKLQGDAFVTMDERQAKAASEIVTVASVDDLIG